ncbi:MAG: formylglycine-generating enzyme family protein [Anaerolineae bacterium]|nr:formylglycine-generating enzyme family protein [Anaerolineae bacterium]
MTRQNYGSLRGGRRGGSGAWQWIVIGFVFGFGCAAVAGLALVIAGATGVINLDGVLAANRPTQTPFIITNTPAPATPTPPPTEQLLPSPTVGQAAVLIPTASPTPDFSVIQVEPSATATLAATSTLQVAALDSQGAGVQSAAVDIPELLAGKLSLLRQVNGGEFQMGTTSTEVSSAVDECISLWEGDCQLAYGEDSAPQHAVTVSPFQMEITEVTYDQYLAFLNSRGPNSHRNCDGQLCIATRAEEPNSNIIFDTANYRVNDAILNYPVAGVTWYGAKSYCEAIGRRLPTEAEWERAARGPNNTIYPWGDIFAVEFARTSRPREENAALVGARPVRSYPVGAWELYDMSGNIAEWVSDWYSPGFYTEQQRLIQAGQLIVDPTGPVAGTQKVVRGGSWDAVPFFARGVHRQSREPQDYTLWIGFRCAADPTVPGANTSSPGTTSVTTPIATLPASGQENTSAQPTIPPPPATATLPVVATEAVPVATLAP